MGCWLACCYWLGKATGCPTALSLSSIAHTARGWAVLPTVCAALLLDLLANLASRKLKPRPPCSLRSQAGLCLPQRVGQFLRQQ